MQPRTPLARLVCYITYKEGGVERGSPSIPPRPAEAQATAASCVIPVVACMPRGPPSLPPRPRVSPLNAPARFTEQRRAAVAACPLVSTCSVLAEMRSRWVSQLTGSVLMTAGCYWRGC